MHSTTFTSAALAAILSFGNVAHAVTGQLGDAPITEGNPISPVYVATLSNSSTVTGTITFTGNTNGTGVLVKVDLANFPAEGGPFPYHVHVSPVNAAGNCSTAGGHLDPYVRGEQPPCDPTSPATCQVGDLSGKHGKVPAGSTNYSVEYLDLYASLVAGTAGFVGNRSVVVHLNSTVRIACASVTLLTTTASNGTTGASGTAGTNGTSPTAPATPPTVTNTGNAGNSLKISGFVSLVIGVVAGVFVL